MGSASRMTSPAPESASTKPALRSIPFWLMRISADENDLPRRSTSTDKSTGASNAAALAKIIDADVTRCPGSDFDAATTASPSSCPPSTTLR